jgi:hypothetical protein
LVIISCEKEVNGKIYKKRKEMGKEKELMYGRTEVSQTNGKTGPCTMAQKLIFEWCLMLQMTKHFRKIWAVGCY